MPDHVEHRTHAVTLITREIAYQSPPALYLALRQRFGEDGTFLLECLVDRPQTPPAALLGFAPILTIEARGAEVYLSTGHALRHLLTREISRRLDCEIVGARVKLADRRDVFALLRIVQSCLRTEANETGFGFFGYFGYDTIHCVEDLPKTIPAETDIPDISLSVHSGLVRLDPVARRATLSIAHAEFWHAPEIDEIGVDVEPDGVPQVPKPLAVTDSITPAAYCRNVATALDHIAAGDIYQVQLGHELRLRSNAEPFDVYLRLRRRNPAPYMVLARIGEATLVGASPEALLRLNNGHIAMRPLAGTIRRPGTPEGDAAAAKALRDNPKEVAEHVMLVDLCRNDLARVCVAGSLEVTVLLATERYSHVFHLVSNVVAELADGRDAYDAIAATFPAGTMSGAPKIRAMEIIEALETSRRGIYAGAFGRIDFASGDADIALCIRTALYTAGTYSIRASAGIVADSTAEGEWAETLTKMAATYWAIAGEELVP